MKLQHPELLRVAALALLVVVGTVGCGPRQAEPSNGPISTRLAPAASNGSNPVPGSAAPPTPAAPESLAPAVAEPTPNLIASPFQEVRPYEYDFVGCGGEPRTAAVANSETAIIAVGAGDLRPDQVLVLESPPVDAALSAPASSLSYSDDLRTLAVSRDAAGRDTLLVSEDGGITWMDVGSMDDIIATATSGDGNLVAAASTDGELSLLRGGNGWVPESIALPSNALFASGLSFDGPSSSLVATLSERVPGARVDLANLVNVWTMDIGTMTWSRVTDLKADFDRWSIAMSPVFDDTSGALLFVVESGLGSGGIEDVTSELWTWGPGSDAPAMVEGGLPQTLLVAGSGTTRIWNLADETGTWHLLAEDLASSSLTDLGCGRSVLASVLNNDPDNSAVGDAASVPAD